MTPNTIDFCWIHAFNMQNWFVFRRSTPTLNDRKILKKNMKIQIVYIVPFSLFFQRNIVVEQCVFRLAESWKSVKIKIHTHTHQALCGKLYSTETMEIKCDENLWMDIPVSTCAVNWLSEESGSDQNKRSQRMRERVTRKNDIE